MKTPSVKIRGVTIGGGNPIVIQSMTNTDTADVKSTALQCIELFEAGAKFVRISIDNKKAAMNVPGIREILDKNGYKNLALIGDFHFNGHELLEKYPKCAETLDKYRINPGNMGSGKKRDENFKKFIKLAIKYKKPIRIGGNLGSIDKELLKKMMDKNAKLKNPKPEQKILIQTLVKSTLDSAKTAEKLGLKRNRIILGVKVSDVIGVIEANELLIKKMKKRPYALHLGLTEAGSGTRGMVASSAALAILLQKGYGDTIRVSITPLEGEARTREVDICKDLLQVLGLGYFRASIVSCPGCGRTNNELFQKIVQEVNEYVSKHNGNPIKIAIMGCVVNGPGEAKHADIALHLSGKNKENVAVVYMKGKYLRTIGEKNIAKKFIDIIEEKF